MNIQQFRQQHPEYNDINDIDLSQRLHQKFYSDMPFEQFRQSFMPVPMPVYPQGPVEPSSPSIVPMPPGSGFAEKLKRRKYQIIGGTLGGIAGGMAVPGPDPTDVVTVPAGIAAGKVLAGRMAGAALFGGAGYLADQKAYDKPWYTSQMLGAMGEEGLGEAMGEGLSWLGGKLLKRPFRSTVIPGGEQADELLRVAGKQKPTWRNRVKWTAKDIVSGQPARASRRGRQFGAHLLPGQTTEGFMDTLQAIGEASIFSGPGVTRHMTQTQPQALKNIFEQFVETTKRNLIETIGEKKAAVIIGDLTNIDENALRVIRNSLYEAVDEIAQTPVNFEPVRQYALDMLSEVSAPGKLKSMLRRYVKEIDMGFGLAHKRKSEVLGAMRQFSRTGNDNSARIARGLAGKIDEAMDLSAKAVSPEAAQSRRIADYFYKNELKIKFLQGKLVKLSKKGAPTDFIAWAKKTPEKNLLSMGFTPDEIVGIKEVVNAAHFVEERATKGGLTVMIRIMQASGIMALAGGTYFDDPRFQGAGTLILVGPEIVARMMLMRSGSRLLSTGLREGVGRFAGPAIARLAREVVRIDKELQAQGKPSQIQVKRGKPKLPPMRERLSPTRVAEQIFPKTFGDRTDLILKASR